MSHRTLPKGIGFDKLNLRFLGQFKNWNCLNICVTFLPKFHLITIEEYNTQTCMLNKQKKLEPMLFGTILFPSATHKTSPTAEPAFYRLVYILLIISAGFIGPLSYFDVYSPHQVSNTYHLTILEDPVTIGRLASIVQAINRDRNPAATDWNIRYAPAVSRNITIPAFVKSIKLALSPYTLTEALEFYSQQLCLNYNIGQDAPRLSSAFLPPPLKPPRVS